MPNLLEIDVKTEEVQKALAGTRLSMKSIGRKTFSVIGRGVVKAINTAMKATLHKRTGALFKAYKQYPTKSGCIVRVNKHIKNGADMFKKIYVLNYGYSGPVGRAHNKPHSFIQAGEAYKDSGKWAGELDKMVDKELRKYWG